MDIFDMCELGRGNRQGCNADNCRLRSYLDARGFCDTTLMFPPPDLCTDNAVMIGWTGLEMFEAGNISDLRCLALRKWSLDPASPDGGILGVPGWKQLEIR